MNPEFKADFFKNALKLFLLMLCLCMLRPKMKTCETFPAAVHPQLWLVTVLLFQGQEKEQESTYSSSERPKALAELTGGPGPTLADGQRFLCLVWMAIFQVSHGIRS